MRARLTCVYVFMCNRSPERQPDMRPMSSHYTCMTALKEKHMKSINTYTRPLLCAAVSLSLCVCEIWCEYAGFLMTFPEFSSCLRISLWVCTARVLQNKWPWKPDSTTRLDGLMPIVTTETFCVEDCQMCLGAPNMCSPVNPLTQQVSNRNILIPKISFSVFCTAQIGNGS